jgi:hypothetical protein
MTTIAHNFIRYFQSLPPVEQKSIVLWIETHKNTIEKGVLDEAFAPMSAEEQNAFWQQLSVNHLFEDWTTEENDIWTNYIHELDAAV